jgi:hypothetical protein
MAWKKSALKHSQTFSCASIEFMDMLYEHRQKNQILLKQPNNIGLIVCPPAPKAGVVAHRQA